MRWAKAWWSKTVPAPATRSARRTQPKPRPTAIRCSIPAPAGWSSRRCCIPLPATPVQELVAYAKANPGKVNFSSGGIGVLPHLIGEMFKARAGIDIVHVPYKGGGPSINDVVAGNVQMTFEGTSVLLPLIQAGRLRALAVTTPKRIPQLPDVPTMVESGFPDFVSTSWTGLLAPAHTPQPIIEKLNAAINDGLKTSELKTALERLSNAPLGGTPADFTTVIKADLAKWSPIIKTLGLDKQ